MKIKQIHEQKKKSSWQMNKREKLLPYYRPRLLDLKVKLDQSFGLDLTENRKLSSTQNRTGQDKNTNIRSLNHKKNPRYFTIENEEQLKKRKASKAIQKFESIENIKKKIADTLVKDLVSLRSIQQSLVRSKQKNNIKISPLPTKKKSCTLDYSQFFVRYEQRQKQSEIEQLEKNISQITKNSRSPLMINIAKSKLLTDRTPEFTQKKQICGNLPNIVNSQQKQISQACSRMHQHFIYELKKRNSSQQKKVIQKSNRASKFLDKSIRINKIEKKSLEEQSIDVENHRYSPWEVNFKVQQHCDHLEDLMKNPEID